MIAPFREILDERRSRRAAAGAFTCYDATTACGVVHAAEARDDPVLLLVSEASVRSRDGRLLLPALAAVANTATVPVCVQLDHATDLDLIEWAVAAGADAVLAASIFHFGQYSIRGVKEYLASRGVPVRL